MKTREFIHLRPVGKKPSTLTRNAHSVAVKTWLCPGCLSPKPSVGAVDVQLGEGPYDVPLTFVSDAGILLIRRDLLGAFHWESIGRDLLLGAVLDRSNTAIPDWLAVRGRRKLIVRGSEDVSYRRCEICERHVYFAMGEEYLFPEPPDDASIYEGDLSLIVTRDAIKNEAALEGWSNLEVKRLKVLERPIDGLGDLL